MSNNGEARPGEASNGKSERLQVAMAKIVAIAIKASERNQAQTTRSSKH
jgi:hypothetical protein